MFQTELFFFYFLQLFHHYIMNKIINVEKHSLELKYRGFVTFNICFVVIDMFRF